MRIRNGAVLGAFLLAAGLLVAGCVSTPAAGPDQGAAERAVTAQVTASADPGASCMTKEAHRQFDFFAGEWTAYDGENERTGVDSVVIGQGGCALFEYWKPDALGGGDGGTSLSFFDPLTGMWRQIWTSPEAQVHIAGKLIDGEMRMEGEIFHHETDRRANYRTKWTPRPDGSVVQESEEFDAENDEWIDTGVSVYRKS